MFWSEYYFNSGKRITIPYRFNLNPGTIVAIRKGPGKCLSFYPWPKDRAGKKLLRIDKYSRLIIPAKYREFVGIDDGGVIIGCYFYFQITNKKIWDRDREKINKIISEII